MDAIRACSRQTTTPWPRAEGATASEACSACHGTSPSRALMVAKNAPMSVRPGDHHAGGSARRRQRLDGRLRSLRCLPALRRSLSDRCRDPSFDWAFGTRERDDLVLAEASRRRAQPAIASRATTFAAACISATSMPAPAMAASRSCRR